MAIHDYKYIKIPTTTSDSINSGTKTVGGILIDNDKALADKIQELEESRWKEFELLEGTNVIKHRDSLYSSNAMSTTSLSEDSEWKVGCEARIGITFSEDASLQYPGTWKWLGDDCQDGYFIFEKGKSYWLFIEKRPDCTWVQVTKCP